MEDRMMEYYQLKARFESLLSYLEVTNYKPDAAVVMAILGKTKEAKEIKQEQERKLDEWLREQKKEASDEVES